MATSMDYLSSSPSLVDILTLVTHKDVLNCKLLNRRIDQVIHRNFRSMPRNEALYLDIHPFTDKESGAIYIDFDLFKKLEVSIVDGCTAVYSCNAFFTRYFIVTGVLKSTIDPVNTAALSLGKMFKKGKQPCGYFENRGTHLALKELMTLITLQFDLSGFRVLDTLPETCVLALVDVIRNNSARCGYFNAEYVPEVASLARFLVCNHQSIGLRGEDKKSFNELVEISSEQRHKEMEVYLDFCYFVDEITDMLKKWDNGLVTLNKLVFRNDENNDLPTWPQGTVDHFIRNLEHATVERIVEEDRLTLSAKRSTDNKILHLNIFVDEYLYSIHETTPRVNRASESFTEIF